MSSKATPKTEPASVRTSPKKKKRSAPIPLVVELIHGRTRHLGWMGFGLVIGLIFFLKLGTIGQVIGLLLVAVALHQGIEAARTFMHPAGAFTVTDSTIVVPEGLCRGKELTLSDTQLEHAFFLRRAVPYSKAGPLLVVEAEGRSYTFPRDWFESDSDQRRVARALNHRLAGRDSAGE